MIQLLKNGLTFLLLFTSSFAVAQSSKNEYKAVDEYIKKIGSLDSMNMGTITTIITKSFPDKANKSRAIFTWIATNISFDFKAARSGNNKNDNSTAILISRKATAAGYANLFQDMSSVANIRCLTVNGYAKTNSDEIGNPPDELNHTWNVVQLGLSPEDWQYVDVAWGSGFTDKKLTTFTKAFNDAYFFADKTIFNYQHYPDNQAWKIGTGPKNKKDFFALTVVKTLAYQYGIYNIKPLDGHISTKAGKAVQFSLSSTSASAINTMSITIGNDKRQKTKQVDYSFSGGYLTFSYKFEEEDTFPVTILIDGKEALEYIVEVK